MKNACVFYLLVIFHHCVAAVLLTAPVVTLYNGQPLLAAWLAIISVRVFTSTDKCVLTVLENKLRKDLGLPTIRTFVHHYFLRHL
jgi:hypothetical protein